MNRRTKKQKRIRSLEDRFWSHVERTDTCWLWTAAVKENGYGVIGESRTGRMLHAHRVSWEMHFGKIPDGMCVLHKCDNRRCVRPDHLRLGTNKENTHDMYRKGRAAVHERHGCSKLTKQDVIEIRAAKSVTQVALAAKYGVTQSAIGHILHNRAWRDGDQPGLFIRRLQVRRPRWWYRLDKARRTKYGKPSRVPLAVRNSV